MDMRESPSNYPVNDSETLDTLYGERIKIIQPKDGYRFSLDAVLLADFVVIKPNDSVLEIGTGSGVGLISVRARYDCKDAVGVELQEELTQIATRNMRLNGLAEKVKIIHCDIASYKNIFSPASFDVVFFNPPYHKQGSGKINPHPQKALARHEIKGSLMSFLAASAYILGSGGQVYLIYPASRLAELIVAMKKNDIEPKSLTLVHSKRNDSAEFVLVYGVKSANAGIKISPPLFIYDDDGEYSREMKKIFNA